MLMVSRKTIERLCTIALVTLLANPALALCPKTTSPSEEILLAAHGCNPSYVRWFRDAFNLQSKHWDEGWGWSECNSEFAFPKMLSSGYLMVYGLDGAPAGKFHDSVDYYTWASGRRHDFRYDPNDENTNQYAAASDGYFKTNRVKMKCPSFDEDAGFRAAAMLHEATHIIYYRYKHGANNPGSNCPVDCSDKWFFHSVGEYPYGQLASHKHSMVQIEVEFNCDLSEFSRPSIPATITMRARATANSFMDNRIRNPPGWRCGLPRPMYVAPEPLLCPSGWKCCEPPIPPETKCHTCVPPGASCP